MDKDGNNLMRNVLTQLAGNLTDAGFAALVSAYNLPAGLTLGAAQAMVRGAMQSVMQNCYDEVQGMALSKREVKKHNMVFDVAERTYIELLANANDNGVSQVIVIDDSYEQKVYETAEHLSLEAIRQSETKKIEVLGRYYGREFYKNGPNLDFQDMHQIINMAGTLSFRQIVLIRLINEGFKGWSQNLFITKQSACVEINRMRDYGLWMTDMAMFKNDASAGLQIKFLKPTAYTRTICEALLLEKISDEDVRIIVDSLAISDQGEPARGITEEDYDANTQWEEYNGEDEGLIVHQGRRKNIQDMATSPEDTAHVHRGEDMMSDASDHAHSGNLMQGIDSIMDALTEFKQCKAKVLYQTTVDDALKELIRYFEQCRDEGGLRILKGRREKYVSVLADLRSDHLKKCQDYLAQAEDKPKGYDKELKQQEIDSWFKDKGSGE